MGRGDQRWCRLKSGCHIIGLGRARLKNERIGKTDDELETWIKNHERTGATKSELYKLLLEERARRQSTLLNIDKSLEHLAEAARARKFTTYGDLANASDVPWSKARHAMNGANGHLDNLIDICHARGMPLLTAICVNQQSVATGELANESLAGFIKAAQRLGYAISDQKAFLHKCQQECFEWGGATSS